MRIDLVYYDDPGDVLAFLSEKKGPPALIDAPVEAPGLHVLAPLAEEDEVEAQAQLREAARRHASPLKSAAIALFLGSAYPHVLAIQQAVQRVDARFVFLRRARASLFHLALRWGASLRVSVLRGSRLEPYGAALEQSVIRYVPSRRLWRQRPSRKNERTSVQGEGVLLFDSGATPFAEWRPMFDALEAMQQRGAFVHLATVRAALEHEASKRGLTATVLHEGEVSVFVDMEEEARRAHDPSPRTLIDALLNLAFTSGTLPLLAQRLAFISPIDFSVWRHVVNPSGDPLGAFVEQVAVGAGCEVVRVSPQDLAIGPLCEDFVTRLAGLPAAPSVPETLDRGALLSQMKAVRTRSPQRSEYIRVYYYPSLGALEQYLRHHARNASAYFFRESVAYPFSHVIEVDRQEEAARLIEAAQLDASPALRDVIERSRVALGRLLAFTEAFARVAPRPVTCFIPMAEAAVEHVALNAQGLTRFWTVDDLGVQRPYDDALIPAVATCHVARPQNVLECLINLPLPAMSPVTGGKR